MQNEANCIEGRELLCEINCHSGIMKKRSNYAHKKFSELCDKILQFLGILCKFALFLKQFFHTINKQK